VHKDLACIVLASTAFALVHNNLILGDASGGAELYTYHCWDRWENSAFFGAQTEEGRRTQGYKLYSHWQDAKISVR
jgi:hypothetical protein